MTPSLLLGGRTTFFFEFLLESSYSSGARICPPILHRHCLCTFVALKIGESVLNKNHKTTTTITTKQTINMPVENHHHRCNELREFILLQGIGYHSSLPNNILQSASPTRLMHHTRFLIQATTLYYITQQ